MFLRVAGPGRPGVASLTQWTDGCSALATAFAIPAAETRAAAPGRQGAPTEPRRSSCAAKGAPGRFFGVEVNPSGRCVEATPPTSSTFGEKDTDSARIEMGNEAQRTHQFCDARKKAAR